MADNRTYLQGLRYQLSGGITATATSITIKSFLLPSGETVTMSDLGTVGYGTLEPSTNRVESFSFTGITDNGDGTSTLTGVTRGLRFVAPYDEVTANKKSHASGTVFIISNTPAFYDNLLNKNNDETITQTHTYTNPNFPRIDDDTTDPTDDEQLATKGYVDRTAFGGAFTKNALVLSATAGETVSAGQIVYFDETDNEWLLADADAAGKFDGVRLGIAQGAGVDGGTIAGGVLLRGRDTNQSGLTQGDRVYLSDTAGVLASSAGTNEVVLGHAISATEIDFAPHFDRELTADEADAVQGAASPTAANPFATTNDLPTASFTAATVLAQKALAIGEDGVVDDAIASRTYPATGGLTNADTGTTIVSDFDLIRLDDNLFVMAWQDGSTQDGWVAAGTVSGTTVTFGTALEFDATFASDLSIERMDATHFAITWSGPGSDQYIIIGDVAGTAITLGTAVNMFATGGGDGQIASMGDNKFFVAFEQGTLLRGIVGTVSGTTPTVGTQSSSGMTENGGGQDVAAAAIGTDLAVGISADAKGGRVAQISGTTISGWSADTYPFSTATTVLRVTATNLPGESSSAGRFLLVFEDDDDTGYLKYCFGWMQGNRLTWTEPRIIPGSECASDGHIGVKTLGDKVIVSMLRPIAATLSEEPKVVMGILDGDDIKWGRMRILDAFGTSSSPGCVGILLTDELMVAGGSNPTGNRPAALAGTLGGPIIGVSKAADSGGTVSADLGGSVSSGHSGLTVGRPVYSDSSGTLSSTPSTWRVGLAISATEVLLDSDLSRVNIA